MPQGRHSYYVRFQFRGQAIFESLRTENKNLAQKRAQALLDTVIERYYEGFNAGRKTTIGQILMAYHLAPLGLSERSKRANVGYFLRIVAPLLSPTAACTRKAMDVVTPRNIHAYHNAELRKGRSGASINSDVRQGRSVLSRRFRDYLRGEGLVLPSCVEGFLEVAPLRDPKSHRGYVPIEREKLAKMDTDLAKLKSEDPQAWLVIALARRTGLRNSEILAATGSWLKERPEGLVIEVRNRLEFATKNGVEGAILLDPELAEALRGTPPDAYLVADHMGKTARRNLVYRKVSAWMRCWLPGREKSLYELRKEAGSTLAMALGLDAAQRLLRHKNVQTTKNYYVATTIASPSLLTL